MRLAVRCNKCESMHGLPHNLDFRHVRCCTTCSLCVNYLNKTLAVECIEATSYMSFSFVCVIVCLFLCPVHFCVCLIVLLMIFSCGDCIVFFTDVYSQCSLFIGCNYLFIAPVSCPNQMLSRSQLGTVFQMWSVPWFVFMLLWVCG